jgi:hypothetical protein
MSLATEKFHGFATKTDAVAELLMNGLTFAQVAGQLGLSRRQVCRLAEYARQTGRRVPPARRCARRWGGMVLRCPAAVVEGLAEAANERGIAEAALARRLLDAVLRDGLIDAVLDDGRQAAE